LVIPSGISCLASSAFRQTLLDTFLSSSISDKSRVDGSILRNISGTSLIRYFGHDTLLRVE
jgi:hypothetical protein